MAVLIVVAIILIAAAAWYFMYRYHTVLVSNAPDASTVTLTCQAGQTIDVISATYTPPASAGGKPVSVTPYLQAILNALSGNTYTVSGAALGQVIGGTLTFRYRCEGGTAAGKSGFRPVPITTCGSPYDDHYAVDMTSRNAAGTVVWDPYSTQSRVSLERYAETPEVAEHLNPHTGLGKTSSVRAMSDRYRRREALQALSIYELQPGEPGFMEEVGDGAMSLMTRVACRSPAVAGGAPSCILANTDIDTDFVTDGYYDSAVLKEALTSRREVHPNTLTASKTGLGSIRLDPRFEPGPQSRVPDGDASWSHGGHAGGPTSGGFGSSRFMPGNTWDSKYVFGFGDRRPGQPWPGDVGCGAGPFPAGYIRPLNVEAVDTERSEWYN